MKNLYYYLTYLFDIKHDKNEQGAIENIKKSIEFKGENLWSLICAIFIASIGLNTNSTAVIIGAMLISPLMGPIVGTGLAVGTNDINLLKTSLKNLLISVIASLITSTLYFYITPISEVQSELLARTYPTIFDVFIALFGGISGIVANTRKEKSNLIPGVAIATALMPPLCTAGYGLANGNLYFFLGAFYLFFINSVFICLATIIMVQYLGFEKTQYLEPKREKRIKKYIFIFAFLTMIPSTYTAWNVINESLYKSKAIKFINENTNFEKTKLINYKISFNNFGESSIELTFIGDSLSENTIQSLKNQIKDYKLKETNIIINQTTNNIGKIEEQISKINSTLKYEIMENIYKKNIEDIEIKNKKIDELNKKISIYKYNIDFIKKNNKNIEFNRIVKELNIYYPQIQDISYSDAVTKSVSQMNIKHNPIVIIKWKIIPKQLDRDKILQFLRVRTQQSNLELINL
jgi:uncharacterized hydrophobic protein (TIGR00271 family)